MIRRLVRSVWVKPIAATVVAAGLVAGYNAYGSLHAHGVVADSVEQSLHAQGLANVQVVLGFAPEQFNTTYLQDRGSLIGIHGHVVNLLGVTSAGVDQIAHQYWVKSIRAYNP